MQNLVKEDGGSRAGLEELLSAREKTTVGRLLPQSVDSDGRRCTLFIGGVTRLQ